MSLEHSHSHFVGHLKILSELTRIFPLILDPYPPGTERRQTSGNN